MKKTSLLSILFLTSMAQAEMYFDANERKFFTYPETESIDQVEYNEHVALFYQELLKMTTARKHSLNYVWRTAYVNACKRAEKVGTPTAGQFIFDISLVNSVEEFNDIMGFNQY